MAVEILMMNVIALVPLVLAISVSSTPASIFMLAGQSNMAGQGGAFTADRKWDGLTPPECQSNPRIFRLNDEPVWEEAHEPLHQNISFSSCSNNNDSSGIGPGIPFSNSLLKRDPSIGSIGLVPCAVGGTGIREWSRGSCLYNRLLNRTRASLSLAGGGGSLRAMLWYQGEADANPEDSRVYGARLEAFFRDLRSDLESPSLPIIQVALASGGTSGADRAIVREAQLKTSLPNVKCVDAEGLPLNGDNVHLTTMSQVRLGAMLADAYLKCFN